MTRGEMDWWMKYCIRQYIKMNFRGRVSNPHVRRKLRSDDCFEDVIAQYMEIVDCEYVLALATYCRTDDYFPEVIKNYDLLWSYPEVLGVW